MLGSTCETAQRLVTGARNTAYGDPRDDFNRTVCLYNLTRGVEMKTAEDAVWFMMCVKMSRESNAHGYDNLVDLCGYADLYNHLCEPKDVVKEVTNAR